MTIIEHLTRAIIIISIFSLCLIPIRKKNSLSYSLERVVTNRIKGVACIMVVVSHASFQLDGKGVFALTYNMGFIAVGAFFFISGYGLTYSLINKNNYLRGFLKNRLLLVLIPFWISNMIVLVYYLIIGKKYNVIEIIGGLTGFKLFIGHNWYVQVILLYYILFFVIAKIINNKKNMMIVLSITIIIIIIISQCFNLKYLPEACLSSSTFILGIIIAYNREVLSFFVKLNIFIKCSLFILMALSYLYLTIFRYHWIDNALLVEVCRLITPLLFVIVIIIFTQHYFFGSTITDIIGKCSFEIYLLHQIPISICKGIKISKGLEILIIVISSFIMGYILNRIDSVITNKIKK